MHHLQWNGKAWNRSQLRIGGSSYLGGWIWSDRGARIYLGHSQVPALFFGSHCLPQRSNRIRTYQRLLQCLDPLLKVVPGCPSTLGPTSQFDKEVHWELWPSKEECVWLATGAISGLIKLKDQEKFFFDLVTVWHIAGKITINRWIKSSNNQQVK